MNDDERRTLAANIIFELCRVKTKTNWSRYTDDVAFMIQQAEWKSENAMQNRTKLKSSQTPTEEKK